MDALEVIKLRRSIRVYENKPISKDVLERVIDVARFSPTARNVQPWEFIVVTKKETLAKISQLTDNGKFIKDASVCIFIFCAATKYYLEDGCSATVNILNAATALGIGSCWVAGDKKDYTEEMRKILSVPVDFKLVSLIALGYPQDKNSFKLIEKRALNDLIHWEKF